MQSNGNSLGALTERIRAKTEADRQELEILARQQFNILSESLRKSSQNALSTTETAIHNQLGKLEESITSRCTMLSRTFFLKWLQAFLLSLSILAGVSLGGWGLARLLQHQVMTLREEIEQIQADKTAMEATIVKLQRKTWGLELVENKDGHFIVLPPKTNLKTGWTVGNREAVKVE